MNSTRDLSVAQIKAILKSCSESGVFSLKWGDLQVEFGAQPRPAGQVTRITPTSAAEIAAYQDQAEQDALVQDEIALREQQVAMAILEDPSLAEDLLTRGDLSDDGSADEDEA